MRLVRWCAPATELKQVGPCRCPTAILKGWRIDGTGDNGVVPGPAGDLFPGSQVPHPRTVPSSPLTALAPSAVTATAADRRMGRPPRLRAKAPLGVSCHHARLMDFGHVPAGPISSIYRASPRWSRSTQGPRSCVPVRRSGESGARGLWPLGEGTMASGEPGDARTRVRGKRRERVARDEC